MTPFKSHFQLIKTMTAVTSFRIVYDISLVFGIFPHEQRNLNSLHVSEQILRHAKILFWILLIIRVLIIGCEIHSNELKTERSLAILVRLGNTCMLEILAVIAYKNVFTSSNSICDWLNQLSGLYSSILGDFRKVFNCNCLIALYSLSFYSIINLPMLIVLLNNGKFISGIVGSFDSATFVFLLLLQNIYLVQFLAFANLARLSFSRINEILRNGMSPREQPRELLSKLKKFRVHHLEVTDFYSFINSVFEFYILCYIVWSFQSTVTCSIGLVMFDFVDSITLYLWMWYHVFQNLPILIACEWVSIESKKSANCLHELMIQNDDPEVKEEVEIFSLQLQQRPVEFNVCGFFILNCKLFITVAGIIITYVIALIQTQSLTSHRQTNSTTYL